MPLIRDDCIVLRRLDFAESSEVLAVFGRNYGKVRLIAKGIRRSTGKRFSPGIDLLDIGHAVLSVRHLRQEQLAVLTEWTPTEPCAGLRTRLDRLYGAQYAAALVAELTADWDPHPPVYEALLVLLRTLAEAETCLPLLVFFQRGLLSALGSLPDFATCAGCRRTLPFSGPVHFSPFEGGLLCRDCEAARTEKRLLEPRALPWLNGRAGDLAAAGAAFRTLDYHITHLLGRPLPLAALLLRAC